MHYTYNDDLLTVPNLYYSYDEADRVTAVWQIISESNMPLLERYEYDAKGQLTRHDSVTQNASFRYEYDKAGNITAKKQYAYTTGALGAAVSTRSYTYSTGGWGDMLTYYNGKHITYAGMGNLGTYDGKTYTHKHQDLHLRRYRLEGSADQVEWCGFILVGKMI